MLTERGSEDIPPALGLGLKQTPDTVTLGLCAIQPTERCPGARENRSCKYARIGGDSRVTCHPKWTSHRARAKALEPVSVNHPRPRGVCRTMRPHGFAQETAMSMTKG